MKEIVIGVGTLGSAAMRPTVLVTPSVADQRLSARAPYVPAQLPPPAAPAQVHKGFGKVTPHLGSVLRCVNRPGCSFFPSFTLDPGVSQGAVRRASFYVPPGGDFVVLAGPIRVPDSIQAPIRTVNTYGDIDRVPPGGLIYRVRFSGKAYETTTGRPVMLSHVDGFIDARHVRYMGDLPAGAPVR